jgi:hypothetical protein
MLDKNGKFSIFTESDLKNIDNRVMRDGIKNIIDQTLQIRPLDRIKIEKVEDFFS